jgi:hypothetical protein
VRDDDEAAAELGDEALQPLQPGEVEVVRRLVEAEDLEARQEERGKPRACRLAARERAERLLEPAAHPDLRAGSGRTRLEVAAAEGEEALERLGVLGDGLRKPLRQRVHLGRRRRHARAPLEVGEQRFAGARVELLRQVPNREAWRRADDRARVRRLEPREQPEKRGLPHAVRADDADTAPPADDERDAIEEQPRAVRLGDVPERDRVQGNLLTRERRDGFRQRFRISGAGRRPEL